VIFSLSGTSCFAMRASLVAASAFVSGWLSSVGGSRGRVPRQVRCVECSARGLARPLSGDGAPPRPRGRAGMRAVPLPVHTCTRARRVPSSCCRHRLGSPHRVLTLRSEPPVAVLVRARSAKSPHVGGLYSLFQAFKVTAARSSFSCHLTRTLAFTPELMSYLPSTSASFVEEKSDGRLGHPYDANAAR